MVINWPNIGNDKVDFSTTFIFAEKKKSWILKIRISKGRTIHLVIKEDRSSASGCNHTNFVTRNGKFWFPVALQCSFIFRNPLCDLPRFDENFFNCFYHQYWPFSVSASCCFQCSFIFRLAMVASDRINRLFHRLHQFPSIQAGAKKYMWFPTRSLASSLWFYRGWSELKLWRHQFLSIYLTAVF